ncbi:hypothetical protein PUNSTDRAFT_143290 [Punctularia strigosozonata HHB-11173 SS5]|uniref:uncharacterized protein n=1 Tax=Punctularia strigosozonata (strain HHB-11173) TaxID=741275 RepID=UPI0004418529|nr:uncharacterized protein PUNSTDRAFT_143290 [Punctularia strigosozonata HHB-11173 SS5]EIN09880.1 hypothetical protein PUNSTDRAFT_143290 [Punctularia strigosozonata HHB-11173 SS5]
MSISGDFMAAPGTAGGPPRTDAYKRAVYRSAPRNFHVNILSPMKYGANYSYGMRITPIISEQLSTKTGATTEYEVWRKWEDCMWFQDVLELEYAIMSREKRQALADGKGVKKTDAVTGQSIYIRSDRAASFESLPPGPDPSTIATDIHQYLPRLSKKGTFFRASQATVSQRHCEFKALIEALFSDDLPSLVKELRASRIVRDFFGFWRRDHDLAQKLGKGHKPRGDRSSIASSAFSMYFSQSMTNLHNPSFNTDNAPPVPALPYSPLRTAPISRHATIPMPTPPRPTSPGAAAVADAWRSRQVPASAPPGGAFVISTTESDRSSSSEASSTKSSVMPATALASTPQLTHFHPASAPYFKEAFSDRDVHANEPIVVPQDIAIVYPRDDDPARLPALPEGRPLDAHITDMSLMEAQIRVRDLEGLPVPPPRRRGISSSVLENRANRNGLIFLDPPMGTSPTGTFGYTGPDEYMYASSYRSDAGSASGSSRRASRDSKHSRLSGPTLVLEAPTNSEQKLVRLSASSMHRLSKSSWVVDDAASRAFAISPRPMSKDSSFIEVESPESRESFELPIQMQQLTTAPVGDDATHEQLRRASSPQLDQYTLRRSLSVGSRRRSLNVNRSMYAHEEEHVDGDLDPMESLIDHYYFDIPRPQNPEPPSTTTSPIQENTTMRYLQHFPLPPKTYPRRPPGTASSLASVASTTSSLSPSSAADNILTIKAVLGDTIVVLRSPRNTPFSEIRNSVAEKLTAQEGVRLSDTFILGYSPHGAGTLGPSAHNATAELRMRRGASLPGRKRASSTSSSNVADPTQLLYITSDHQWQDAIADSGPKLILRVIDLATVQ